ncbi:hypothetical protein [Halobacterium wangiae]|uniref:hypothetical protein n=1 Tax=Halobacterium wangiae TaxID=2902623 RepID=UPI001E42CE43|nr:hypothetical protein [Halobacterium wangiae]
MHDQRKEFGEGMEDARTALGKIDPNYDEKQIIGELVRFCARAKRSQAFSDIEVNHLQTWIDRGKHVLQRSFTINETLALRKYGSNLRENPWRATKRAMALILSLGGIEAGEAKIGRGSSLWRETLESLDGLADGASYVLTDDSLDDHHGFTWFLVLNAIEVLNSVIEGEGHDADSESEHSAPTSDELRERFNNMVEGLETHLNEAMESSSGLQVYAYDLSKRGLLSIDAPDIDVGNLPDRSKVFHALGGLNRGNAVNKSSLPGSMPSKKPHLWALARAWIRAIEKEPTGVIPFFLRVNTDSVFQEIWSVRESKLEAIHLTSTEEEAVNSMDDGEIQERLKAIFADNSAIAPTSRRTLSQETRKSHGPWEISDFDIELDRGNKNAVFVSLPIKSAVEAGGKSVEKMSEQHLNQILRPFLRFEKCAVFPVIIAGHTAPVNETVKILRSRLDLPIKIIDGKFFAKLLKHHNELPT